MKLKNNFFVLIFASIFLLSCDGIKVKSESESYKIALEIIKDSKPISVEDVNNEMILIDDRLESQGKTPLNQSEKLSIEFELRRKMADYKSTSNEVTIGKQVWMSINLDVDKFRNGDPIAQAKNNEEWISAGKNQQPAWCYYENISPNGEKYGKLYNWYAISDDRGLAPYGWHIPSDDEWSALTKFLGDESISGTKLKSNYNWAKEGNGTNETGFSGLPGGFRGSDGIFYDLGKYAYWWSSTVNDTKNVWNRNLYYTNSYIGRNANDKIEGLSVRCIKD